MTEPTCRIKHGDAFHLIPGIAPQTVHAIISDPPYFLPGMDTNWVEDKVCLRLTDYHKGVRRGGRRPEHGGLVRMQPNPYDPANNEYYRGFCARLAKAIYLIIKPGGFVILFTLPRFYHIMATELEREDFEIRDVLAWHRHGHPKAFKPCPTITKRTTPQLRPDFETMVLAQRPKDGNYKDNWIKHGTGLINTARDVLGRFPGTSMHFARLHGDQKHGHFTAKPTPLMTYLIYIFSKEGDVILDPFLGSGTTAVAALNAKRSIIGFENNKNYYDIATNRIKHEVQASLV